LPTFVQNMVLDRFLVFSVLFVFCFFLVGSLSIIGYNMKVIISLTISTRICIPKNIVFYFFVCV